MRTKRFGQRHVAVVLALAAVAAAFLVVWALWPRPGPGPSPNRAERDRTRAEAPPSPPRGPVRARPTRPAEEALPSPIPPAFTVATPPPLRRTPAIPVWAPILRAVDAHAAPSASSRVVARVDRRTPEGTANIVVVLARANVAGDVWVRVSLAVLPNGTSGWVPRDALGGYVEIRTRLVVDLRRLRATLLRDGRRVFQAAIGVGQPAAPTPRGRYYVRNKLARYRSPFYGPLAFGTSARSPVLTDWPAGGFVGIHGTNRPDLLPGRVSHGCIRMANADIIRLARLMPVGTTVVIR